MNHFDDLLRRALMDANLAQFQDALQSADSSEPSFSARYRRERTRLLSDPFGWAKGKRRFGTTTETFFRRQRTGLFRGGLATAALLCVALLTQWLSPRPEGMFTVSAYALDLDESGAVVLREADFLETSDYWGGYRVGDTYYVSMGLRYEGTEIQSVTFTTEEGCFARQQITSDLTEEDVSRLYIGPDDRLIVFGTDFEPLGDTMTLEGPEMDEGTLLFWGVQALSPDDIPKNPRITAQAVFQDGSSETLQVTLDLSGTAVFGGQDDRPSEGPPVAYRQSRYYKSLPLEDCQLVDEQTVTDVYEYTVDGYTISHQVPDDALYDESGLYRSRRLRISGDFYLPVFQREGETCTARLYRVPEELEFSPENEAKADLGQTPEA